MTSKPPQAHKLEIKQPLVAADTAKVDTLDAIIILLPESSLQKRWPDFPHADRLKKRIPEGKTSLPPLRADLPNPRGTVAIVASYKADASTFEFLTLARKCLAKACESEPASVGLLLPGSDEYLWPVIAEALVAAVAAADFEPPQFKMKPADPRPITSLTLFDGKKALDFKRTLAEAEGNRLARWLTMLPANFLTPTEYRGYVKDMARREGWKFEFLDKKRLKSLGAGAFLAVAQGSDTRDAGIVHLIYRPAKAARDAKHLALVGKGICYDTGGVNLKSDKSMFGMHGDMQGSAVALGTLLALTRLKVPFRVDAWLAIARNQVGPKAYTQNDVIKASNGVNIEIMHTDAEGRMVLADTLALATREKPGLTLDYATLTGACVMALGTRYCGAFTQSAALAKSVIAAGIASGERVWPFPMDADYDEAIESEVADVKQCVLENSRADHILASRFLSRFVDKGAPWIHVDLAASDHKGGLAHVPTEITGFGVRFTLNLLLDQGLAPR